MICGMEKGLIQVLVERTQSAILVPYAVETLSMHDRIICVNCSSGPETKTESDTVIIFTPSAIIT